jgi:hypothetical protein
MSAWLGAGLALLGAVVLGTFAGMLRDEIRGRAELLPHLVLRLAIARLPGSVREDLAEEWRAELAVILEHSQELPVTRLLTGLRFAGGLLRSAPAIARELGGRPRRRPSRLGMYLFPSALAYGLVAASLWRGSAGEAEVVTLSGVLAVVLIVACRVALDCRGERAALPAVITLLCRTAETRDLWVAGHSRRVARGSVMLAKEIGIPRHRVESIWYAGMLHDLGKLTIPAEVLQKRGLTRDQRWMAIYAYPMRSLDIVDDIGLVDAVLAGVMHHREWYNGRGYPLGLAGKDIPESSRIIAIVDVFDCMTVTRPYRGARTHAQALAELRRAAGTQFDPVIVEAFIRVVTRDGWDGKPLRLTSSPS